MRDLFFLGGSSGQVRLVPFLLWREGIAGRGEEDQTQGSLWSGTEWTSLRAVLQFFGLALPAGSICQPR